MYDFMPTPCKHCPFRNDVTPFLHPERAAEISYVSQNPYSSFPCHKTIEHDEEGEGYSVPTSKECAGMLTMRAQASENVPKGFKPSYEICYIDPYDMIEAYEEEYNKNRKLLK